MPNVRAKDKTAVLFWSKKSTKKRLQKAASDEGLSVTEYLHRLIDEDIERKKKGPAK